jgi:hypothetical protein
MREIILCALLCVACKRDAPPTAEPEQEPALSIGCPAGTMQRGAAPPDGHRVWCETAEGVSHGPFRAWYPGGSKKSEGAFERGEAHGEWVTWYEDGKLRSRGNYENGKVVGDWTRLDREGGPEALYVELDTPLESKPPDEPPIVIGIPACDLYLHRMYKCVDTKAPDTTRVAMRDALDKTVEAWEAAASGPGRDALESGCKAAYEAVQQAVAEWGCEF